MCNRSDCPGLSYGCRWIIPCVFPQVGGCTDATVNQPCDGPAGADGTPMPGVCFGSPVGTLCVLADPLDVDSCTTNRTLCQPPRARRPSHPRSVSQTPGCSEPSIARMASMHVTAASVSHLLWLLVQTKPLLGDCSYAVNGETIEGTCFGVAPPYACLTECDPINGVGCANPLNPCQPTGAIGDPSTDYVCIPGGTFSGIEDCPSGTAAYADGSCITPSALAGRLPTIGRCRR